MDRLGIWSHDPALLLHAIEMMNWAGAVSQGMGIADRGCDIGFCQQHCFGQSASHGQMTGDRGGKGATCAMS